MRTHTAPINKLLLLLVSAWSFVRPAASCNTVDSAGSNSGGRVVTVKVHVRDEEGNPVANEQVKLEDHGPPRLGDTYGETADDGCLIIKEGTGPRPCNHHKLLLPFRPDIEAVGTGCNNAGEFEHTFTVEGLNMKIADDTTAPADLYHPREFVYFWREKFCSKGGGIRLVDEENKDVVAFFSYNPQWVIFDGSNYTEIFEGNGYDMWVQVRLWLDWSADEFGYFVSDGTTVRQGRMPMAGSTKGVHRLVLSGIKSVPPDKNVDIAFEMFIDALQLVYPDGSLKLSFEDGSMAGWEILKHSDDFGVVESPVFEGSYAAGTKRCIDLVSSASPSSEEKLYVVDVASLDMDALAYPDGTSKDGSTESALNGPWWVKQLLPAGPDGTSETGDMDSVSLYHPHGIAFHPLTNSLLYTSWSGTMYRLDFDTRQVTAVVSGFGRAEEMAVSSQSDIAAFHEDAPKKLFKVNITSGAVAATFNAGSGSISAQTVSPSGDVYFVVWDGSASIIYEMPAQSEDAQEIDTFKGQHLRAMAFDNERGIIYMGHGGSDDTAVSSYEPGSHELETVVPAWESQGSRASTGGLALSPNGDVLYVTEAREEGGSGWLKSIHAVGLTSPDHPLTTIAKETHDGSADLETGWPALEAPTEVFSLTASDTPGLLYYTDRNNDRIIKLSTKRPPTTVCNSVPEGKSSGDVKVTVYVQTTDGRVVANERVKLEDHGPPRLSDFDESGRTSATGCLVIYKGTGPRPCNHLRLLLPDRPDIDSVGLGCYNAGEAQHTLVVTGTEAAQGEEEGGAGGKEAAVLGPAIGVPVGIVVLALIVVMILAVRRPWSRHGRRVSDTEHPGPVSRESSDNYSMTIYEFFGPHSLTPAAHPPMYQSPLAPQPPCQTPAHTPPSIFNPVYGWLSKFSASFAEENGTPPEGALARAVPPVADSGVWPKSGHAERPSALPVNEPPAQPRGDPQPQGECLICLDGEPKYGFLHSGTLHLGVCENCLPSVQRQRVRECMVCRAKVEQIIRVH